ncbi:hypothetical protein Xen7305DRAFT_00049690 [Xenococcus sp. PCC 7305]|uniref:DUF2358 domain-containing protein n=1 Tax=Xenococcus sp. PCC 7305 TaxID=102125 RepID=UPI0002AC485E|nr:DUF2358 domain-containing protein [Xenococcus sp. PCC 7305]ELS05226.1 hypothetical protein Xen7305DRAFT_00049690 [Xenococcus sp. PCC 7305]
MPDQSSEIDLVAVIKQDYQQFPKDQTYSIYAEDVYFEDPLNKFQGIGRYQKMIGFLGRFFGNIDLELHNITQDKNIIKTEWTLKMTSPLPWKPLLVIPGWSELEINQNNLIVAHRDYWNIAPIKVLLQNFRLSK